MKTVAVLTLAVLFPLASTADDSLYQVKCAKCHGKHGEGKASMKVPSLVSPEVKKMSEEQIRDLIRTRANGEMEKNRSHTFMKKRLTDDEVNRILVDVRELQAKRRD